MKKILQITMICALCLLESISALAYDFEVDGIRYDIVSLSEYTCKVVGVNDKICEGDIVIPAQVKYANKTITVVEIASKAFYYYDNLTGITIPNTVNSIGNSAFDNCI